MKAPAYYRSKAEEMRSESEASRDAVLRQQQLKKALAYEALALRAQDRLWLENLGEEL